MEIITAVKYFLFQDWDFEGGTIRPHNFKGVSYTRFLTIFGKSDLEGVICRYKVHALLSIVTNFFLNDYYKGHL